MPPQLFGFSDRDIRDALEQFANSGRIDQLIRDEVQYPMPFRSKQKMWYAACCTQITSATPASISSGYKVGEGECNPLILDLDADPPEFQYITKTDGTNWKRTVYNPFDTVVKVSDKIVFPITVDRKGNLWITKQVKYKPWCRFTFDSDLTTSDTYIDATIESQWGYGFDHPSNDINVYNFKTHTPSTFMFEADSGDYGYAFYDPVDDRWYINPPECP